MNVVDSSGWLEYFAEGPNAGHFAPVINLPEQLVVPTVTLYEVFKVALRESNENDALQACSAMQQGLVADFTAKVAVAASKLSLKHALPMADAVILATAREHGATLWTQDVHFKDISGVKYFPK
ncbi:MAG: type II toxin-antitoxin system VapC family toxin [Syntrophales bacterium]